MNEDALIDERRSSLMITFTAGNERVNSEGRADEVK
jgi:hypothetical protein